ncbi:MAG: hypothetical protein WCI39_07480 [Gallionellaceae bacterium]
MELSPLFITVIASLGGAIVGALPGLLISFFNQRAEAKRQFNELVVKAAVKNWKMQIEHGSATKILPLEYFIVHTSMMSQIALSQQPITPAAMEAHLKKISSVIDVLVRHATATSAKQKEVAQQ